MRYDGWTIRLCYDPSSLLYAVDMDPHRYRDLASVDREVAALRFEEHVVAKLGEAFPGLEIQPRAGSERDGIEVRPPPATLPDEQRATGALMIRKARECIEEAIDDPRLWVARPRQPRLSDRDAARELHRLAWSLPENRCPMPLDGLPERGLYLMFEAGERAPGGPRIVRVAESGQETLAGRIRADFEGRRELSPLRMQVGCALLARSGAPADELGRWRDPSAPMPAWEESVSELLRRSFSFVWIDLGDPREAPRSTQWLIDLLSTWPIAPPSEGWLGRFAGEGIASCGLWNGRSLVEPRSGLGPSNLLRLRYLQGAIERMRPPW